MTEFIQNHGTDVIAVSAALSAFVPELGILTKILNFFACNWLKAENKKAA